MGEVFVCAINMGRSFRMCNQHGAGGKLVGSRGHDCTHNDSLVHDAREIMEIYKFTMQTQLILCQSTAIHNAESDSVWLHA
jgi:hypothetical protein